MFKANRNVAPLIKSLQWKLHFHLTQLKNIMVSSSSNNNEFFFFLIKKQKVTDCSRSTFPGLFEMYLLYLKDKSTTPAFKVRNHTNVLQVSHFHHIMRFKLRFLGLFNKEEVY